MQIGRYRLAREVAMAWMIAQDDRRHLPHLDAQALHRKRRGAVSHMAADHRRMDGQQGHELGHAQFGDRRTRDEPRNPAERVGQQLALLYPTQTNANALCGGRVPRGEDVRRGQ